MPITYTNRKGVTYYLCRGVTKTGKPRYHFAREPKGEPVEQIPEGFKISESVNGIVSLVRDRPALIWPEEVAAVEAAVRRHPKSHKYRVNVKHNRIEVYEQIGPDAEELAAGLAQEGFAIPALADRLRPTMERRAQFTPVLRFILADAERRTFRVERMCYLGSIDDWIDVGPMGTVDRLARHWIPKLGTDQFFGLLRPV
jgi:hypothetical protein